MAKARTTPLCRTITGNRYLRSAYVLTNRSDVVVVDMVLGFPSLRVLQPVRAAELRDQRIQ
jgi:hypothetical protein